MQIWEYITEFKNRVSASGKGARFIFVDTKNGPREPSFHKVSAEECLSREQMADKRIGRHEKVWLIKSEPIKQKSIHQLVENNG